MKNRLVFLGGLFLTLLTFVAPTHGQPPTLRSVVTAGQRAPGGGTFEHFTIEAQPVIAPVNSRGQVAFFATLLRGVGSEGLFLASGARLTKVAAEGDKAPGGGFLSGFSRHPIPALNERGTVAFAAAVSGGKTVEGIFVASRGRLQAVALAGEPAPGILGGTLATLDAPTLNDHGDVAFLATVRRGRETVEAIFLRVGARLRKIVAQEDPAPAGGNFAAFGPPALNNKGAVAFAAVVEGLAVPGGVFITQRDKIQMVLGAGDPTPIGGIFAKFSERVAVNNEGAIAFNSILKSAPVPGAFFVVQTGHPQKIAALGDAAPDGGTFSHFGFWPALSAAGTVAFTASVDHGPSPLAIFVGDTTGILKVVGVGDPLPGVGNLASFGLYPVVAISSTGGITFATALTSTGEGSEGIFFVEPAPIR
jgi:hypothetical protein